MPRKRKVFRTQLFKFAYEKFFQLPFWYRRNGQPFFYELSLGGQNLYPLMTY